MSRIENLDECLTESNYLVREYVEIRTLTMKSVKQIGNAALTRLIKTRVKDSSVWCSDEKPNLGEAHRQPYYWGNDVWFGASAYAAWGIELGLVVLDVGDGDSLLDALKKAVSECEAMPSHILIGNVRTTKDSGGPGHPSLLECDSFHIFRLTQEQENQLKLGALIPSLFDR